MAMKRWAPAYLRGTYIERNTAIEGGLATSRLWVLHRVWPTLCGTNEGCVRSDLVAVVGSQTG